MNRRDYLASLESKLTKLNPEERGEAISYYNEIFDEREIFEDDEVPQDMPNPRQASYEILRDINIDTLEENDKYESLRQKDKKPSVILTAVLVILALPIGLPLSIALLVVLFAFTLAFLGVNFGIFMTGIASIGSSIYELIFVMPTDGNLVRTIFLIGIIFIGIALILLAIKMVTGTFNWLKKRLITYKNNKEQRNEKDY